MSSKNKIPKTREYYLSTSSSRDFAWFLFKAVIPPPKRKPGHPSSQKAALPPRSKPAPQSAPKAEESSMELMAPDDVKERQTAKEKRTDSAKNPKPRTKKKGSKPGSLWSAWYVSEDHSYMWRARRNHNKAWDYQISPRHQHQPSSGPQIEVTTPTASSSSLSQQCPPPDNPSGSPYLSPTPDMDSPKSSWPTILTTSTGQPTNDLTASSSQTLATLPKEGSAFEPPDPVDAGHDAQASATTTSKTARLGPSSSSAGRKRPVGPVMRLIQEGTRNRRQQQLQQQQLQQQQQQKFRSQASKSTTALNTTTTTLVLRDGERDAHSDCTDVRLAQPPPPPPPEPVHKAAAAATTSAAKKKKTSTAAATTPAQNRAMAKKFHAKVKMEKEMRMDPKRRVKAWLKKVDVDWGLIPLDAEGLPVYR